MTFAALGGKFLAGAPDFGVELFQFRIQPRQFRVALFELLQFLFAPRRRTR